jgi:uncharacterized protein (TIGR03435 family)
MDRILHSRWHPSDHLQGKKRAVKAGHARRFNTQQTASRCGISICLKWWEWAYGLEHYQLAGRSTLDGRRYDVRAQAGAPTDVDSLRLMLQDLLATRFRVELHREKERTSVYELVVARDGSRLPRDKADSLPPSYPKETLPRVVDGGFVFTNVSMTDFAKQLTELRGTDLPVLDQTRIKGIYDITLKSAARALLEPDGPSLLTLIHEQPGLKLVSTRDFVDVIVVDRAEAPTAN